MLLQIQPNSWSCLPTAFASILGVAVGDFIKLTGHNGSTKIWPDLPPPRCYRSWHIQELIEVTLDNFKYAITTIESQLASKPIEEVPEYVQYHGFYFKKTIANCVGIVSVTLHDGEGHAIIFEKGKFYDTRLGKEINSTHFILRGLLWRFDEIKP